MNIKILIAFLVFFSIITLTPQAFACSCAADRGIEDAFYEKGSVIFSGKVLEIVEQERTNLVTIELEQSWKGIPEGVSQIKVLTGKDSAMCGYNFELENSYLVEAYGVWDQSLDVSLCGITTNLESAGHHISYLNANPVPEFVVQSVEFMQDIIYPDELGFYEVEITDKEGNPVNMFVTGRVDYEAPWGQSNFSPVGNYDKKKEIFVGELTAPDQIAPGIYTLKLDVHGLHFGSVPFSGIKQVEFEIGERPGSMETLFSPTSLEKIRGAYRFYDMNEPRVIELQLVKGHYYSPILANHSASVLVYGIDKDGNQNMLEAHQLTSDSNGMITQEIFLNDRNFCEYDVLISSEYNGFEHIEEIDYRITNTKTFHYTWENEKIPVTVEGKCSVPLSMDFDQMQKTMTVQVDTTDAKRSFEVHFPHKLLDGDLTATLNGNIDDDPVSISKREDVAIIYVNSDSDMTIVQIIGTSAIPEFEFAALILLAAFIPVILFRKSLY